MRYAAPALVAISPARLPARISWTRRSMADGVAGLLDQKDIADLAAEDLGGAGLLRHDRAASWGCIYRSLRLTPRLPIVRSVLRFS